MTGRYEISSESWAMIEAIVCAGAKSESEICGRLPITMVTAIVSPKARPKPSTVAPKVGGTPAASKPGSSPPPSISTRTVAGFGWEGDVPWQKWTQLYNKVVSRFSTKGLRLRVTVEVAPGGGVSEQELEDTRTALKELGLPSDLTLRGKP